MSGKKPEIFQKKENCYRTPNHPCSYCLVNAKESNYSRKYNGSVVKTKKASFYNELIYMLRKRYSSPSYDMNYATSLAALYNNAG